MDIESLASKVKFLDQQYREGKATVSDAVFDKLENNLRRIDPKNDYFNQKLVLPSLENGRANEFLENLLPDTRLIITPKIDGCAIALQYENGSLIKAISRKGKDVTAAVKTVNNIPTQSTIHVRGGTLWPYIGASQISKACKWIAQKKRSNWRRFSFLRFPNT